MEYKFGFFWSSFRLLPTWHWLVGVPKIFYGSGRAAIIDCLRALKGNNTSPVKVFLPAYICFELVDALRRAGGMDVQFYALDEKKLLPSAEEMERLNGDETSVLLLVNFFGTAPTEDLQRLALMWKGPVIFDAVHCFLAGSFFDFRLLPKNWTLVLGYRKIFNRVIGAVVFGSLTKKLTLIPKVIPAVSGNFPGNLTLTVVWGRMLSWLFSWFCQWSEYLKLAGQWQTPRKNIGILPHLACPVEIGQQKQAPSAELSLGAWPELSQNMPPTLLRHAQNIRDTHAVYWKRARLQQSVQSRKILCPST